MRSIIIIFLCLLSVTHSDRKERRRNRRIKEDTGEDSSVLESEPGGHQDGSDPAGARERSSRGLVPQLLPNYTEPALPNASEVGCSYAFMSCMYRGGCSVALQQYELTCASLVNELTDTCSRQCQHALIALVSTEEGERMMKCRCEDAECERKKRRIEPCRAAVTWQSEPTTQVSCSAATWICLADPLCAKALEYYNDNCNALFKGRKCSRKCKNSLNILLRQESANKLATCFCDGTEEYDCVKVRENTEVLCFGKKKEEPVDDIIDNTIDGSSDAKGSAARAKRPLLLSIASVIISYWLPEAVYNLRSLLTITIGL